jgi:hypothetical protein
LMQVQAQDSYSSVQMPTSKDAYVFPANAAKPTFARFPSHGYFSTVPYYKDATEAQALVHYRPGVEPFLRFCFEHFNVGFWSTAGVCNVHHIALNLLRMVDRQPADLMCAWARCNTQEAAPTTSPKFIDALTNEVLVHPVRGTKVSGNHKDLWYVYERFPGLKRQYITLVDNLPDHAVGNADTGVLWIPPFFYLNCNDTVLSVLLRRLKYLYRIRCPVKATDATDAKEKVVTGTRQKANTVAAKTNVGKAGKAGKESADTATKSPEKPSRAPLLVHAGDLRTCLEGVSGTNDAELYPGGYVTEGYNRSYALTTRQLRRYHPVLVPVNGRYRRGVVRSTDTTKDVVTVRVTRPKEVPPGVAYKVETVVDGAVANQSPPKKGTRKRVEKTNKKRTKAVAAFDEHVVPAGVLIDASDFAWAYGA